MCPLSKKTLIPPGLRVPVILGILLIACYRVTALRVNPCFRRKGISPILLIVRSALVETLSFTCRLSSGTKILFCWILGFCHLFVLFLAWETLFPARGLFPVMLQRLAISFLHAKFGPQWSENTIPVMSAIVSHNDKEIARGSPVNYGYRGLFRQCFRYPSAIILNEKTSGTGSFPPVYNPPVHRKILVIARADPFKTPCFMIASFE